MRSIKNILIDVSLGFLFIFFIMGLCLYLISNIEEQRQHLEVTSNEYTIISDIIKRHPELKKEFFKIAFKNDSVISIKEYSEILQATEEYEKTILVKEILETTRAVY